MRYRAHACDYNGTLASRGRMEPETAAALARVRASGRRIILVNGRELDNLRGRCPNLDPFDLVVAENGGVLFDSRTDEVETLAEPPPAAFLEALTLAGVPFAKGRVIVSTMTPHEITALEAVHVLGLDLHVVSTGMP